MPYHQKKTRSARFLKNEKTRFADFSVLEHARDEPDEEATDLSRIKDEFIQWKRPLSPRENEEGEEELGCLDRILLFAASSCYVCEDTKDSLYVITSEKESRPRKGPPSRPLFERPRSDKPRLGSRSKSPNLRKPSGQNNTRPRRQPHTQHRSYKLDHKIPSHQIPPKKGLRRSELEKYYVF